MQLQWQTHSDDDTLSRALAEAVAADLARAIGKRGQALIAVSGGSTPRRFMEALSRQDLDWSKVTMTLVDERWVPPSHPRSNARLADNHLQQGKAAPERRGPLYGEA